MARDDLAALYDEAASGGGSDLASLYDEVKGAKPAPRFTAGQTIAAHAPNAVLMGLGPIAAEAAKSQGTETVPGSGLFTAEPGIDVPARTTEGPGRVEVAKDLDASAREHPVAAIGANVIGGLGSPAALVPAGAATLPGRIAAGGGTGLGLGAAYGFGSSPAEDLEGRAVDAAKGGAAGLAFGAALPIVGAAARKVLPSKAQVLRWLTPKVTPTPAAQAVAREGVPLTTGQLAGRDSFVGQLEAVSADNPMGMKAEREAAKDAWRRAQIDKGLAPGAPKPKAADLQARSREVYESFTPAYDEIRGQEVPGDAVERALAEATETPGKIDARTKAGVRREVENALTILPEAPQATPSPLVDARGNPIVHDPAPLPPTKAGDLMKAREVVREQIRIARKAQDFDRLRLLEHADDVFSEAIESGLTPDLASKLQQVDRQYARLQTVLGSAPGGQTDFTPGQLARSVERSTGRRAFKLGKAGDLQDAAEAAGEVFAEPPMTGFRAAFMRSLGKYGGMAAGPMSRLANTPAVRDAMLRRPIQPPAQSLSLLDPKERAAMLAWLRTRYAAGPQFAPAGADEEGRR